MIIERVNIKGGSLNGKTFPTRYRDNDTYFVTNHKEIYIRNESFYEYAGTTTSILYLMSKVIVDTDRMEITRR